MKKILLLLLFFGHHIYGQDLVQMTIKHGVENQELKEILQFQNISYSKLKFEGEAIKNKYYILRLKEFKNGELVNTTVLFDESGNNYFKIDSTYTAFKFLSQINSKYLKVWIRGEKFASKQSFFDTDNNNGKYVLKDFLGSKSKIEVSADKPFYIFAIITASKNPDGSGSYCRVAQSEVNPEKFGQEYNIPHYFLIEMEFLKE